MRARVLTTGSVVLLFISALALLAQTDTATITGIVTDASGAAVPRAAIDVVNTGTSLEYRGETNDTGVYSITALPIGS